MEEKSKKLTIDELIEAVKKRTKNVIVTIDKKEISLPIFFNLSAMEIYINKYESTHDVKEAFCYMILDMISHTKELENQNLTIENIKTISDKEFKKIGEVIINDSDELIQEYKKNKQDNFFENFHIAIMSENDKFAKQMQKIAKVFVEPASKIAKAFEPIQSLNMNNFLSNINDMKAISNTKDINYGKDIDVFKIPKIEPIKPEDIYTNKLLQKQIEADENIAKILLENKEENRVAYEGNRIANKEATKLNIKNYKIMVATLIATIISIILAGISLWVAIKGNLINQ